MFPFWNFFGCFVSAIQIRNWRPIAASAGIAFVVGLAIDADANQTAFVFLLYLAGIPCALWTQQIIQDARDEIDRKNNKF